MTDHDKLEWEADYERAIAALDGLMTAQVELECPGCGLGIHVGDAIQLGERGWLHPVCAVAEDVAAEQAHDQRRERGL